MPIGISPTKSGLEKGLTQGLTRGETRGKIHLLQELLGEPQTTSEGFAALDDAQIEAMLIQLRQRQAATGGKS